MRDGDYVSCLHELSPVDTDMNTSLPVVIVYTTLGNCADWPHYCYKAFFLICILGVALSTPYSLLVSFQIDVNVYNSLQVSYPIILLHFGQIA